MDNKNYDFEKLKLELMNKHENIINEADIGYKLFELIDKNSSLDINQKSFFKNKATICQQKINMMLFANDCANKYLDDFEITQNMDIPCLFGESEKIMLYHTESTILFARNALDVVSTILANILLNIRCDSFNTLIKKIKRTDEDKFVYLKKSIAEFENYEFHALTLLCGTEKGRALRDQIIHQTNIKLEYQEYDTDKEKEILFVVLNQGETYIPYRLFMFQFIYDVISLINYFASINREEISTE